MKLLITPDNMHRIVITRDMRREAGIGPREKLEVTVSPGMILISPAALSKGKVVKRGKLKVFTGDVPDVDLAEAVNHTRRYTR